MIKQVIRELQIHNNPALVTPSFVNLYIELQEDEFTFKLLS